MAQLRTFSLCCSLPTIPMPSYLLAGGPLIPKAASMTMRLMFSPLEQISPRHTDTYSLISHLPIRSPGYLKECQDMDCFHFAFVRNPIVHFVDGFAQVSPIQRACLKVFAIAKCIKGSAYGIYATASPDSTANC
eukprot:scaffold1941_cov377-Prasinococcus_capsulatus_cf.AAC.15